MDGETKVIPLARISRLGMRMDRFPIRNKEGQILVIDLSVPYTYLKESVSKTSAVAAVGFNAFNYLETEVDLQLFGLEAILMANDPDGHGAPRLIDLGVPTDIAREIHKNFSDAIRAILDQLNLYHERYVNFEWQGITPYAVVFVDRPIYDYPLGPLNGTY